MSLGLAPRAVQVEDQLAQRTRFIHFSGTSIKDFRFFRVVSMFVSNRLIPLVDAACLCLARLQLAIKLRTNC